METATLWEDYQRTGDTEARDRLVLKHLPLVHYIARRMARSLAADIEMDDLLSAGTLGLINAISRFDPARGVAFSTFAAPRIRGAILDDLRRWDHASRSTRRKQRALAVAKENLTAARHRTPADEETARAMGLDIEDLWRWELAAQESVHVSLDEPIDQTDTHRARRADVLADDGGHIEDAVEFSEVMEIVKDAIQQLPERERTVLALYYYEELKLHEIGKVLELTESRVSQIRTKALNTLRSRLGHLRRQP